MEIGQCRGVQANVGDAVCTFLRSHDRRSGGQPYAAPVVHSARAKRHDAVEWPVDGQLECDGGWFQRVGTRLVVIRKDGRLYSVDHSVALD